MSGRTSGDTVVGEAFEGEGADCAHVNVVLGRKGSPTEGAFVGALASPTPGHVAFLTVVRPDVPVRPFTLFVNKATLSGDEHSRLTWGAAQAGIASGVLDAVADGVIPAGDVDDLLLLAAVWVSPEAADEEAIYRNNRAAVLRALTRATRAQRPIEEAVALRDEPANPYFRSRPT
ncbi:MAG TPA: formaldehyde-activating enzyme [Acidimicrobiales bacterium]|nr:formaldehyde-activating enzyme [Acidimicrobiales bacterium]